RIMDALVVWSSFFAKPGGSLGGGDAAGIADGSGAKLDATSCPMPDAWKYAIRAISAHTTPGKYRLSSASIPMGPACPKRPTSQRRTRDFIRDFPALDGLRAPTWRRRNARHALLAKVTIASA